MNVRAKKALGQHFLKDEAIAKRIVDSLIFLPDTNSSFVPQSCLDVQKDNLPTRLNVLEIGPGTGVLTKYLLQMPQINLELAEIDTESIDYLRSTYPQQLSSLEQRDFLAMDLSNIFKSNFAVIGNFPYNISSQIFFKILDSIELVPQVVCMLQKEVAERLASPPGNKSYGILSVLLQTWYNIEYLFTVNENVFLPPPKVKSGVIRLTRNNRESLACNPELFKQVIKVCFNQRRKTIRNSIKPLLALNGITNLPSSILLDKRPEQLSVEEFIELCGLIKH